MQKGKEHTLTNKWLYRLGLISLLYYAILLPFQPKTPPLIMGLILALLAWLLSWNFKAKLKAIGSQRHIIFLMLYYLWCIAGVAYTSSVDEGWKDVFQKLPFFLFALLFGSLPGFAKQIAPMLVKTFLVALGVICVYSFISAGIDYAETSDPLRFHFKQLTVTNIVPPHYLGMYLNFGYAVLVYHLLHKKHTVQRTLDVVLALLFAVTIVFLSVRMQYLTFLVINLLLAWRIAVRLRGRWVASFAVLGVLAIFTTAILAYPGSRRRVIDAVNEAASFREKINDKQTNHRKFLWSYGLEAIQEKPLLGHGTGGGDHALHKKLQQSEAQFWDGKDLYYIRDMTYNFHNAYLQHLATHGTIGFGLLLVIFLVPLLGMELSATGRLFLVVCGLSFLTESMLQRQAGIVFFSFFYTLLISGKSNFLQEKRTTINHEP